MRDIEQEPFEKVVKILDKAIEIARPVLMFEGIEIHDSSNRSGHDKNGPYYLWQFWFEKRRVRNVIASEIGVWLRYFQPLNSADIVTVECKWSGEVYHVGSRPFFSEQRTEQIPVAMLSGRELLDHVLLYLHAAEHAIPDRYKLDGPDFGMAF